MSKHDSIWPVLKTYDNAHLTRIALPLGGIGTGTVSLGGRGDLRDFRVDALSHLDRAGRNRDRAVRVNVNQRSRLIHRRFGKRNAETNRLHRDAFFNEFILFIKLIGFRLYSREIEFIIGLIPR